MIRFHRQIPYTNIYSELYGGVEQGIIFYFDIFSLKKVLFKKDSYINCRDYHLCSFFDYENYFFYIKTPLSLYDPHRLSGVIESYDSYLFEWRPSEGQMLHCPCIVFSFL